MAGADPAVDPGTAAPAAQEGPRVTARMGRGGATPRLGGQFTNRTVFVVQKFTLVRLAVAALCSVVLAACATLTGTGDPNVAATVNDTEVLVSEVEQRYEQAKTQPQISQQLEQDTTGAAQSQLQAQILTQLVLSELLEQWATELDIEASDAEVAEERDALVEQLGGEEAFETAVDQSGLTDDEITEQIRQRVLQNKIAAEVAKDVEVSDEQVADFYEENAEARFGPKATARHILVEQERKAGQIMADLRDGADFAKLAEKESTDTGSAQQGGELPEFGRGQMVGPFEDAVFKAEEGDLVGPVETEFGYHVIEVLSLSEGQELDDVSDEIRAELTETQEGEVLQKSLGERSKEAEVDVNPRFGTWNAEAQQVEPVEPLGDTSEAPGAGATEEIPPLDEPGATEAPPIPTDAPTG
ncbi:MAG: hypothetical protein GEU74_03515 [Nitriliruptorales bacterium]|nr:hypothetical protein [Nitriliruptorales bacterium]